jgi:hypothetical protein
MATIRNNVQDFMSAIRSAGKNANGTSPNLYGATLNADGFSVQVVKNGAVIYSKIVYNGSSPSAGPQGDGNIDTMTVYAGGGSIATGSVTNFLATLT